MKRCSRCIVPYPITTSIDIQTHCPICSEKLVDVPVYELKEEEKKDSE